MTEQIKKLYKASRNDKDFEKDMSIHGMREIDWFWSDTQKTLYASVYFGWLVGKGKFNPADFL